MANCFASVVREADTAADAGSAITLRIGAHLAWADGNDPLQKSRPRAQHMRTVLVEPHPRTHARLSELVASSPRVVTDNVAACPTRLDGTNVTFFTLAAYNFSGAMLLSQYSSMSREHVQRHRDALPNPKHADSRPKPAVQAMQVQKRGPATDPHAPHSGTAVPYGSRISTPCSLSLSLSLSLLAPSEPYVHCRCRASPSPHCLCGTARQRARSGFSQWTQRDTTWTVSHTERPNRSSPNPRLAA